MDASHLSTPDTADRIEPFDAALRKECDAVRDFLAAKQRQLSETERQLAAYLDQLAWETADGRHASDTARQDADHRTAQLAREAEHLEQLRNDLDARRTEWQRTAEQTTRQQESLLETLREEQHSLQQQRASLAAEKAELQRRQADSMEIGRARQQELQRQLKEACDKQDRLASELATLHTHHEKLKQERAEANAGNDERDTLLHERDVLADSLRETERQLEQTRQELAEAERRAAASAAAVAQAQPPDQDYDELQRRYELTLDDLRDLKRENARLQEQLEQAQTERTIGQPPPASGGPLNWEAEKQRILAALESEAETGNEEEDRQRLEIKQIVRRTDRIVSEKNAEIAELKQLLENQSASVGSLAVGAAALGDLFDKDALIQEERANLLGLQEQWREKLRQAEVELSVERAKIARQRTEVEEKLRLLQDRAATLENTNPDCRAADKPPRNRWLTRLGMKDPE